MKVLIVASDKGGHFTPFIEEQMAALTASGDVETERFGVVGKGAAGYLKEIPRLCRTIREVKPDIIHAHYGLSGLLAGLTALTCRCINPRTGKVPVVTTYHGSDINEPKVLRLSCIAMCLSAWNIFVSKRNVDIAVKACSVRNYSLVPCGVNLTDDQLLTREEARKQCTMRNAQCAMDKGGGPIILFAGAFDNAVKDAPLAQKAVSLLYAQGAMRNAQLVELRGYSRQEVNLLMCAADCLLLTSKREGSPQVIKEAMACGCPIVSVDVGDVAERIAGIDGCYLVRTRDPREIASQITKALDYKGKTLSRQRIIDCGLSNEQVAQTLIHLYQEVLNR